MLVLLSTYRNPRLGLRFVHVMYSVECRYNRFGCSGCSASLTVYERGKRCDQGRILCAKQATNDEWRMRKQKQWCSEVSECGGQWERMPSSVLQQLTVHWYSVRAVMSHRHRRQSLIHPSICDCSLWPRLTLALLLLLLIIAMMMMITVVYSNTAEWKAKAPPQGDWGTFKMSYWTENVSIFSRLQTLCIM